MVRIGEEQRHKPTCWLLVTMTVLAGPLCAAVLAQAVWEV